MFKRFLIWSSGGPPVRCSGTIYAILKEGTFMRRYLKFRPVVQDLMSFKENVKAEWTDRWTTDKD